MRKNGPSILKTAIIAAVLCFILHSATADTWYVENEWNYMDVAMNADNGIPEDAEGNLSLMTPEKDMPAGAEIC